MAKDKDIIFVEMLLRNYKAMKAERFNLNIAWGMLEREKNNAIAAEYLTSKKLTDMPGIPREGLRPSTMFEVANEEYTSICNKQSFITSRLHDLEDIITAIDNSLNSLEHTDKDIVFLFYIERMSLEQIATRLNLNNNVAWKKKIGILVYMSKSLSIFNDKVKIA